MNHTRNKIDYDWINNVASVDKFYTSIIFNWNFDKKIEPNSLPINLRTLTFGNNFNQKIELNSLPINLTTLTFGLFFNQKIDAYSLPEKLTTLMFGCYFNQKIEPNSLPKNLTTLTFGRHFNQKIEPNILPDNLTSLTFGHYFNQIIEPNSLPKNLTTLTFGFCFNQKIDLEMLPYNLKNINFNWMDYEVGCLIERDVEMVNNIPSYYHVKLFLIDNLFDIDFIGPKWPIHVIKYDENKWSTEIYEVYDEYIDPIHGHIAVLINKESYKPYSFAKSALK